MFFNYLKIAWRNLLKQKVYAFVNVIGMSAAFSATIILVLVSYREWSYNKFHENRDRIYQFYREEYRPEGLEEATSMAAPMMGTWKKECPGIEKITRFSAETKPVTSGDQSYNYSIAYVDPDFLNMFSFPLLQGDNRKALAQQDQILITEKVASAVFKDGQAVGKPLTVKYGEGKDRTYIVSGVMKNVPELSSIKFELLARFERAPYYDEIKDNWHSHSYLLFAQLQPGVSMADIERLSKPIVNKYFAENIRDLKRDGAVGDKEGQLMRLKGIPLTEWRFSKVSTYGNGSSKLFPWLLILLGVVITMTACVNFVNLSIARSFTRTGEIGLRKALGAIRWQLGVQFWCEAFILCMLSMTLCVLILFSGMKTFNAAFHSNISLAPFVDPLLMSYLLIGFALITLLAGGYPAWLVSKVNVVEVLKGKLKLGSSGKVRNALIIFQFIVATLLISCTLVISQQLHYMRIRPLGFDKDQVVSIPLPEGLKKSQVLITMRDRLLREATVLGVTGTSTNIGLGKDGATQVSKWGFDYKGRGIKTHWQEVGYDYAKTLGVQVVAGRDFSRTFGGDSTSVVINEELARVLQEKEPVGAFLDMDGQKRQIIGVIKNYNFESLHQRVAPLMMTLGADIAPEYIFVKVTAGSVPTAMPLLKRVWEDVTDKATFEGTFLDENTQSMYKQEQYFSIILRSGAGLAIIISCMGLFAIGVLVISQRSKEVGIRKVLGASVMGIVGLLSKDFIKLVLIALVFALPACWYVMSKWLAGFAYRVEIAWWVYAVTAVLAIVIAFMAVSFQSLRAALSNPVKSLKDS